MGKAMSVAELDIEVENLKASETACRARLNHNLEKIEARLGSIEEKLDKKVSDIYSTVHTNRRETDNALMSRLPLWATTLIGLMAGAIGWLAR